MSQTVADILVHTLEEIGVRHIFGLVGDSLNPLADAVRRSRLKWSGCATRKVRRLPRRARLSSPGGSASAAAPPAPAAPIWSPASMRRRATMRPSWRCPATCRASCTAPISSRPPSPTSFSRRLALHRDLIRACPGASHHPSGDCRRLCGPRRCPPDPAAGMALRVNAELAALQHLGSIVAEIRIKNPAGEISQTRSVIETSYRLRKTAVGSLSSMGSPLAISVGASSRGATDASRSKAAGTFGYLTLEAV
jgi:Thiamine pyrophosphate enzyme, N-terminal TPP binding domain